MTFEYTLKSSDCANSSMMLCGRFPRSSSVRSNTYLTSSSVIISALSVGVASAGVVAFVLAVFCSVLVVYCGVGVTVFVSGIVISFGGCVVACSVGVKSVVFGCCVGFVVYGFGVVCSAL